MRENIKEYKPLSPAHLVSSTSHPEDLCGADSSNSIIHCGGGVGARCGDDDLPLWRCHDGHAPHTATHNAPDGAAKLSPEEQIRCRTVQVLEHNTTYIH